MVDCGKDMIKDILLLLILNVALPTNDVGSDLWIILTNYLNGEYGKATTLLAPVLLNFLFTLRPWWQMESESGRILTFPILLAQLWPQYRACLIIYKIIKGDPSAGNDKVVLEREIGVLEPFFESVPTAFIMCFFMTKDFALEQNVLGLCSKKDGHMEIFSFAVSVLSASFGVTKLFQSGPCKIFPAGGLLVGLCTVRFITAFLSTLCTILGKFCILIGMMIITVRLESENHTDFNKMAGNCSLPINDSQKESERWVGTFTYYNKIIGMFILLLILPQLAWSAHLVKQAVYVKKGDESDYISGDNDCAWCWGDVCMVLRCPVSSKKKTRNREKWRHDIALLYFRYPSIFYSGVFSTFTFGIECCCKANSKKSEKVVFTKAGTLGNIAITWIGAVVYVFFNYIFTIKHENFAENLNILLLFGWLGLGGSLMAVGQICSIIFMTFNTCCCQCCPKDCVGLEYHSIEVVGQYELKLGPHMPTKVTDD